MRQRELKGESSHDFQLIVQMSQCAADEWKMSNSILILSSMVDACDPWNVHFSEILI